MEQSPPPVEEEDRAAIVGVARDYLEGYIDGDADRLGGSLHPDARKRAVDEPRGDSLALDELDIGPWLECVRARGPVTYRRDADVVVLGVYGEVATASILSERFVDYLHLARFGEHWLIVNVLYTER